MKLLAIDPGNTHSAYVLLDNGDGMPPRVMQAEKVENSALESMLREGDLIGDHMSVELAHPRGMPASYELFLTTACLGRLTVMWEIGRAVDGDWSYMDRLDVKMYVCGSSRANDSNIRQALVDMYGGKRAAIGLKATPGPLHGFAYDMWQALGIGIAYFAKEREKTWQPTS